MNEREERTMARRRKRKTGPVKGLFLEAFRAGGGYYDFSLLFIVLLLVGVGLIMVYSTSYYSAVRFKGDSMYYLKRQGVLAFAGIIAMIFVSRVDYKILLKRVKNTAVRMPSLLLALSIVLQFYVLINGVDFNGAKRWISLGPLGTFQPSDFAKVAVIIYVAYMIHINPRALDRVGGFVRIMIPVMIDVALIAKENVSTAIVITLILGGMCFIASRNKKYFLFFILLGVLAVVAIFLFGEGFRMARFNSWKNVESDENAFQTLQGLYAIASGGLMGRGLGQSTQKLGYVPEAQNDWIFSIICEELGLVGACVIILAFLILLWRVFQIAVNSRELFGGMICVGVLVHVASQVLLNVAVVTNSIPATGVALPFISYGGTSVAMMLIEIGLALSVSYRIGTEQEGAVG